MKRSTGRYVPWATAAALGALVGSRSLLVPALVARTTRGKIASRVWSLLAALEMGADKTRWIPSRTAPLSLAGRMLVGAAVAFAWAAPGRGWTFRATPRARAGAALVGASCAAASAFLLRTLRVRLGGRSRSTRILGGLVEDVFAMGVGRGLIRA